MQIGSLLDYFDQWTGRPEFSRHRLHFGDSGAVGLFGELVLKSAFQPLFGRDGGAPLAYEALLRVEDVDGNFVPLQTAFAVPETAGEIVYFDRLCRMVHVVNFMLQNSAPNTKLFLNVDGRHLINVQTGSHGAAFETLLRHAGLPPERVVLEIVESDIGDLSFLDQVVSAYQQRGFHVAIDDFGAHHSNFDRLWKLNPDIVKLDRSLLLHAQNNKRAHRILPKLVELLHDLDAQVVCEGIETDAQWLIAQRAGADMMQGFRFSRPSSTLLDPTFEAAPLLEYKSARSLHWASDAPTDASVEASIGATTGAASEPALFSRAF